MSKSILKPKLVLFLTEISTNFLSLQWTGFGLKLLPIMTPELSDPFVIMKVRFFDVFNPGTQILVESKIKINDDEFSLSSTCLYDCLTSESLNDPVDLLKSLFTGTSDIVEMSDGRLILFENARKIPKLPQDDHKILLHCGCSEYLFARGNVDDLKQFLDRAIEQLLVETFILNGRTEPNITLSYHGEGLSMICALSLSEEGKSILQSEAMLAR